LGKEKLEKLGEERKVLALIKNLIYARERKEVFGTDYERTIKVDQKCKLIPMFLER
jgi:hypothetical protein